MLRHNSASHALSYSPAQELPPAASHEILSPPYRGGSAYGYATKPSYFSNMSAYSIGYVEELPDYGMNTSSQLNQDMVSYPSSASWRDYGYGGATTSLVHRPAPSVTDSGNFSLSHMATHLPGASSDRLLPAPSNRSLASAVYTGTPSYKALPPAGGIDPSPIHAASVLADMASSSYGGSFDATGLPYNTSTTSLQAHNDHTSRTTSEAYSPDTDSIFTEHEHSLRSQGSAIDLHTYTYGGGEPAASSLRRASAASGGPASGSSSLGPNNSKGSTSSGSGSSVANSHHGYMSMTAIHDSASNSHHHHVPLAATAVVPGGTASAAYLSESSSSSGSRSTATICNGSVNGGETRRATVGGRR